MVGGISTGQIISLFVNLFSLPYLLGISPEAIAILHGRGIIGKKKYKQLIIN
jgi:hypothetical protein